MKIALVAISGVRVVNPKLVELGVTLPQFVRRGEVIAQLPSLALLTLAAHTPEEVEVEYLEVPDVASVPVLMNFDLVVMSSYTAKAYDMYEYADRHRAHGILVVLGGLHVTQVPLEALAHADAVCIGEGERIWPTIVRDFQRGGVHALQRIYRDPEPGRFPLSESKTPRFELLRGRDYNRITVQTSRGCPLDCEFCGASKLYGSRYRKKPVAHVVRELETIQSIWGRNAFIEFADDNSFANRQWTTELLGAIQHLGIRWFTETDISIAEEDSNLRLLRKSGCRQLLIGFESVSKSALDGLEKRNWKLRQHHRYLDAIKKIQDHGVSVNGCFIVGHDADDISVFEELRAFIAKAELLEVQVTVLTPFPGTRLFARFHAEKRLRYEHFWDRCTLFDVVHHPLRMTAEQLEEGHLWLMKELYNENELATRQRHYIDIVKRLRCAERQNSERLADVS